LKRIPTKLKPWFEARKSFKLSHAHTQMARELGMNPRKLGKERQARKADKMDVSSGKRENGVTQGRFPPFPF
jgi:hypothetical protein